MDNEYIEKTDKQLREEYREKVYQDSKAKCKTCIHKCIIPASKPGCVKFKKEINNG